MSLSTKNTEKGDLDRSNKSAWDKAPYWSEEAKIKRMITKARSDGWTYVHGGDQGAYWRGVNPETKRVEKLPTAYTSHLK